MGEKLHGAAIPETNPNIERKPSLSSQGRVFLGGAGGVTFPLVNGECHPVSHDLATTGAKRFLPPPPAPFPFIFPRRWIRGNPRAKFSFPTPLCQTFFLRRFLPFVNPPLPSPAQPRHCRRTELFCSPSLCGCSWRPRPHVGARMWGTTTGVNAPMVFAKKDWGEGPKGFAGMSWLRPAPSRSRWPVLPPYGSPSCCLALERAPMGAGWGFLEGGCCTV